jgi:hypothetical protein
MLMLNETFVVAEGRIRQRGSCWDLPGRLDVKLTSGRTTRRC